MTTITDLTRHLEEAQLHQDVLELETALADATAFTCTSAPRCTSCFLALLQRTQEMYEELFRRCKPYLLPLRRACHHMDEQEIFTALLKCQQAPASTQLLMYTDMRDAAALRHRLIAIHGEAVSVLGSAAPPHRVHEFLQTKASYLPERTVSALMQKTQPGSSRRSSTPTRGMSAGSGHSSGVGRSPVAERASQVVHRYYEQRAPWRRHSLQSPAPEETRPEGGVTTPPRRSSFGTTPQRQPSTREPGKRGSEDYTGYAGDSKAVSSGHASSPTRHAHQRFVTGPQSTDVSKGRRHQEKDSSPPSRRTVSHASPWRDVLRAGEDARFTSTRTDHGSRPAFSNVAHDTRRMSPPSAGKPASRRLYTLSDVVEEEDNQRQAVELAEMEDCVGVFHAALREKTLIMCKPFGVSRISAYLTATSGSERGRKKGEEDRAPTADSAPPRSTPLRSAAVPERESVWRQRREAEQKQETSRREGENQRSSEAGRGDANKKKYVSEQTTSSSSNAQSVQIKTPTRSHQSLFAEKDVASAVRRPDVTLSIRQIRQEAKLRAVLMEEDISRRDVECAEQFARTTDLFPLEAKTLLHRRMNDFDGEDDVEDWAY